jgi:dTDP-4-amino-4,6-dideoxygalactose transaminase
VSNNGHLSNGRAGAPSFVPLVDLSFVHDPIRDELRDAFDRVVTRGVFSAGPEGAEFEAALATYVGATTAVGVGSGTAALLLMLQAAGIGPGDEVILPPNTFFATAEAVVSAGATPVLADVDPATALIDPAAVEAAITPNTAAIIAVHLYGQPADMTALRVIADRHSLFLFEDAAQAIGARWQGRPAGSLGDAAGFSFYPGKNLGALGEAGAVTTNDEVLAAKVRALRSHGEPAKYVHRYWGTNERLDELQAAFLTIKLRRFDEDQARRDEALATFEPLLAECTNVTRLQTSRHARHVHHLLVVRVAEREHVLESLHHAGIGAGVHYPKLIQWQDAWTATAKPVETPHAAALANSVISLPLFPGITTQQIERTVEALTDATDSLLDVEAASERN